jgi:N-acyl-L-homoserine lactone synthetase
MLKSLLFKENDIKFIITQQKSLILKAKRLVHDVYLKVGYLSHPLPQKIFPPEENFKGVYLIAINNNKEIIGTLRISQITNPLNYFKEWKTKISPPIKKELKKLKKYHCESIENLVVKETYWGKKTSGGLFKAAWIFGLINEIDYYLIKMDKEALKSLKRLGWYCQEIAPPIFYLGSLTVPAILPLKKQLGSVFRKNSQYFKYLIRSL